MSARTHRKYVIVCKFVRLGCMWIEINSGRSMPGSIRRYYQPSIASLARVRELYRMKKLPVYVWDRETLTLVDKQGFQRVARRVGSGSFNPFATSGR